MDLINIHDMHQEDINYLCSNCNYSFLSKLILLLPRYPNLYDTIVTYIKTKPQEINNSINNGITPLMTASYSSYQIVELFLKSGVANINLKDNDGWTALHYCINSNDVKILLEYDINPSLNNVTVPTLLDTNSEENLAGMVYYIKLLNVKN